MEAESKKIHNVYIADMLPALSVTKFDFSGNEKICEDWVTNSLLSEKSKKKWEKAK